MSYCLSSDSSPKWYKIIILPLSTSKQHQTKAWFDKNKVGKYKCLYQKSECHRTQVTYFQGTDKIVFILFWKFS